MSKLLFFSTFFIAYFIYIYIAFLTSKSLKSIDDYFLAGKNLNLFQIIISLIATQLGGGFILGISENSYKYGYYGLFYTIGICLGFLILGFWGAAKLSLFKIGTINQIFEDYYNSKFLRKASSLITILSLIGIFTAQIIGSKSLLLSLNLYDHTLFIFLWLLIIVYAVLGGLRAIVQNDIIQLVLIIIVFLSLFFSDFIINFTESIKILSSGFSKDLFENISIKELIPVAIIPALYSLIEQDLAQIFFASKDPKYSKLAAFFASIFLIFFALIPLYFGIKANILKIDIKDSYNPLISLLNKDYNSIIIMTVGYGVLAAIISTANGVLCAISSCIFKDFNLYFKNNSINIFISKSIMLITGITGLLAAFYLNNIVKVLVESYSITVSSILISVLAVYIYANKKNNYKIKLPKLAAYLSFFSGLFSFIFFLIFKKSILINPEFDSLIISFIFYVIGFLIRF